MAFFREVSEIVPNFFVQLLHYLYLDNLSSLPENHLQSVGELLNFRGNVLLGNGELLFETKIDRVFRRIPQRRQRLVYCFQQQNLEIAVGW